MAAPSPTIETSDGELLRRFAAGRQEAAFAELVRRYLPLAIAAALRRLQSRALAEEAAQNAFIVLVKKAASVPPERLAAWIHRTAWLEACHLARSEQRLSRPLPLPEPSAPAAMNRPEAYDKLDAALQTLPELDRELLLRRYSFGENVREIASRVGKSTEACQKRLERAMKCLRGKLGAHGTAALVVTGMQHLATAPAEAALVSQVTAGALESTRAGAAGAGGGMVANLAACLAAAALASAAAWPRTPEPRAAASPGNERSRPLAKAPPKSEPPLAPRPAGMARSLVDVLDSIHSGRLGPLVEFLPNATVEDLRAILREDDLSGMGERTMDRSTAHWLAIRHWATIEPATAWEYALSRDREGSSNEYRIVTGGVFRTWMRGDPAAAWEAFAQLTAAERAAVGRAIAAADDALCEEIIARYPEHYWQLESSRLLYGQKRKQENSQHIADAAIGGTSGRSAYDVAEAFCTLAEDGAEHAAEQAQRIPDAALRSTVMATLASRHPERMNLTAMPAGKARQAAMRARYAVRLKKENLLMPNEPDLQAVWLEARGARMAYDAPMQLLESIAGANLTGQKVSTAEPGDYTDGPDWLVAALSNAGRLDGARTMKLLPGIIRNVPDAYLPNLLEAIIQGWAKSDPVAAIRWTSQHDIPGLGNDLLTALGTVDRGGEALLAALPTASEDEAYQILRTLSSRYDEELSGTDPDRILRQVTPEQADQLLRHTLNGSMGDEEWVESMRIVSHASRQEQLGYMLPNLATRWLCSDAPAATAWIQSLPAEDQQSIFDKAGSHYEFNAAGRAAFEQLKR